MSTPPLAPQKPQRFTGLLRRYREFALIARDPVLLMSLLFCGIFLFVFVFYPIWRTAVNSFFDAQGKLSLTYFARYFDAYYGPFARQVFFDTLVMGVLTALGGTAAKFRASAWCTFWRWCPPSRHLLRLRSAPFCCLAGMASSRGDC
jgi:ABC-type spermidine/putrescine transport system permease subunit I